MIETHATDTEALVQQTFHRIADQWTPNLIAELHQGERGFFQLKMLTKTLRQLQRDGLVQRGRLRHLALR